LKNLDDNYLMLGVKTGDLDKMGLLFERHHKPLFGYLYHQTGHAAQSEDLVQNVFYRMLKYRNSFSETGEFRAWMFQMARNVLIDHAKKTNKISFHANLSEISENHQSELPPDIDFDKKQADEKLHEALNKLSTEQREIIILSKFQEMPYLAIAKIFNTTEGNIKVKVYRAIKALKETYLSIENEG
jgi:RNA polymerase sigma factor (sigma-70 family)